MFGLTSFVPDQPDIVTYTGFIMLDILYIFLTEL